MGLRGLVKAIPHNLHFYLLMPKNVNYSICGIALKEVSIGNNNTEDVPEFLKIWGNKKTS